MSWAENGCIKPRILFTILKNGQEIAQSSLSVYQPAMPLTFLTSDSFTFVLDILPADVTDEHGTVDTLPSWVNFTARLLEPIAVTYISDERGECFSEPSTIVPNASLYLAFAIQGGVASVPHGLETINLLAYMAASFAQVTITDWSLPTPAGRVYSFPDLLIPHYWEQVLGLILFQDEIDTLRQEYVDFGLPIPERVDVVEMKQPYNGGNYEVGLDDRMVTNFQSVLASYRGRQVLQIPQSVGGPLTSGLALSGSPLLVGGSPVYMCIVGTSATFSSPKRICKMSDNSSYVNYIDLHTQTIPLPRGKQAQFGGGGPPWA